MKVRGAWNLASMLGKKQSWPVVHQEAFKFLDNANSSRINWTVAEPLSRRHPAFCYIPDQESKYRRVRITPLLIDSIRNYFRRMGIDCSEKDVVLGNGVVGILQDTYNYLEIAHNKQQVLLPTPTYGVLYQQCNENGIKTDFLRTTKQDDWKIKPEVLDKKLRGNRNIKILLVNFPNNPTGKVMDEASANDIAEVLRFHPDVIVVSDEILSDMVIKDGVKSCSIASIPSLQERTIVLSNASKSRGLFDLRIAFAYVPEQIANLYPKITGLTSFPTSAQLMMAQSLIDNEENREFLVKNIEQYRDNIGFIKKQINLLNQKLNEYFGEDGKVYVKPYIESPEAGNVYLLDFSGLKDKLFGNGKKMESGLDVAKFLLGKADIGVVPGECFFLSAEEMLVRIPSSTPQEEIEIGFDKIGQAVIENLKNSPNVRIGGASGSSRLR